MNSFHFRGAWLLPVLLALAGCKSPQPPIGADQTTTTRVYRQTHNNPVGQGQLSSETKEILHRFEQNEAFHKDPDAVLAFLQRKAVADQDRDILFALAELSYLSGERLRHSVKPWEPRDPRDYFLASATYSWLFLFGDAKQPAPGAFDQRFRSACDLYNFGLGWALTERRGTNAVAVLAGGVRSSPAGKIAIQLDTSRYSHPLTTFERFLVADHFVVRGLGIRNRQSGLGAPLVSLTHTDSTSKLARAIPATALLRVNSGWEGLAQGRLHGSLELYSPYDVTEFSVDTRTIPLETDTTISLASTLNQSAAWRLGKLQFLSGVERVPTGIYYQEPHRPGRVPVIFVHGTFSSPVKWAEMANALAADPVLRQRYQFWYYIYNSGNPTLYSSTRLRNALRDKIHELDPDGNDPALQQMVVVGHSQGGLLTKLTATDTGDKLMATLVKTNEAGQFQLSADEEAELRQFTCFQALPFVKRVVFISTPHRGSYGATGLARTLARKVVSLPSLMVQQAGDYAELSQKLDLPEELKETPTSIDSMSPNNPVILTLAEIPIAPGIKGHSIIAVKGDGDYREGKDGLVRYESAHVDYVESELVVRSVHSCQGTPPAIEEVRRILHEHIKTLPAEFKPMENAN